MKAFRTVTSPAVVLDRADVDTDQIIPKQFLKRIERTGFGEFLFFDWRKDPAFELEPFQRHCLLEGLDEIALTLAHVEAIAAYEAQRRPPVSTTALA